MAAKKENPHLMKWYVLIVMAVAFGIYSNTLDHGYVLDDFDAIVDNVTVRQGSSGITQLWQSDMREGVRGSNGNVYRPLTMTLFALEWEFWPDDPGAAHVINVLLYALACALLFYWLSLILGTERKLAALFVTLLFVVHPVHTEVVANIKSADELLMFIFGFIALIGLWKNVGRLFSVWLAVAVLAFTLALLSKESAVTLIGVALLCAWFFGEQMRKQHLISVLWLALPFATYLAIRASVLGGLIGQEQVSELDNLLVSAEGSERYFTGVSFAGLYVWKLIAPHPLNHDYSLNHLSILGADSFYPWLALLVLGALLVLAIRQVRQRSMWSFAILFLFVTLSLYSNLFVLIGTHFGERLLFLPSVGFSIALGWFFWKWHRQIVRDTVQAKLTLPAMVLVALLIALGARTMMRNGDWKSELSLYEADVENAPNSARTHYRLGLAYNRQALNAGAASQAGWFKKALPELKQSVEIYPAFSDAHNELGLAYHRLGDLDRATNHVNEALNLNNKHVAALVNKGAIEWERNEGHFRDILSYFEQALEINPNYELAASNLGAAWGSLGKYEESIRWFKRATEINPGNAQNYFFIGLSYQNMGDTVQAMQWAEKAYTIDPGLRGLK